MTFYSEWTATPLDSGYSSSSTKKEKQTGLLGSLKDFFKGKRKKTNMAKSDSDMDITDNYTNFPSNNAGKRSSFSASPYEEGHVSPNSFFNNQGGVVKSSDIFRPKPFGVPNGGGGMMKPKEPSIPEFEIPIAAGPIRQPVFGLFGDTPPAATTTTTQGLTTAHLATSEEVHTPSNRSSVGTPRGSRVGDTPRGSRPELSSIASRSPSLQQGPYPLPMPSQHSSSEEDKMKSLSPQHSDLSVSSEDPRLLYKQIQEKETSRAKVRRGSLPNSLISDASVKSERSEGRRKRRRSGPKKIGPEIPLSHEEEVPMVTTSEVPPPTQLPPTHLMPPTHLQSGMHPYYMGDPRYMPHPLPYMPHPPSHMIPPPGKGEMPHPLHHHMGSPPQDQYGAYQPHPQMYPMYHPMYGGPPPVMFQSVKEEGPGGEGSGHYLDTPPKKATVKRNHTMESKPERKGRRSKNKASGSQVDEGEEPKGFDDFALY